MKSLSVKYRPKEFCDVLSQEHIIKILEQQITKDQIKNAYLFVGPSGVGKTTIARIFAKKLNGCKVVNNNEEIILGLEEIDAASNSGVDDVRRIIDQAQTRSLEGKYKIFIIDECHSLSSTAWQTFLKTLEEPPTFSIFIFCTTNSEKIPQTIQNRVMRFNLSKVPIKEIERRLIKICEDEKFTNYEESCKYIAQYAEGSVRAAIAYLEKVSDYSKDITLENVTKVLGTSTYQTFFDVTNALKGANENIYLNVVDNLDRDGKDTKLFLNQYIDFILEVLKFIWSKDISMTYIPDQYREELSNMSLFRGNVEMFNLILTDLLELKNLIRADENPTQTLKLYFVKIDRELDKLYRENQ